ncbi:MAG TPA: hypothetical protein VJA18_02210 [Candidatus Nanoarchaeia archaeon]|nr:hypothetical protein [Candidatus Nanoarchaeia archaeon]
MVLTLNLGTPVPGNKLAEVVEASMREIDDWQFEKRRNARVYGCRSSFVAYSSVSVDERVFAHLLGNFSDIPSGDYKGTVAYAIRKKSVEWAINPRDVGEFIWAVALLGTFTVGLLIPLSYKITIGNKIFEADDSIFTLIHPDIKYNSLEFHANAASNSDIPRTDGVVKQENSPQFKKIQSTYIKLVQGINRRLPLPPYRTPGLVL